MTFSFKIPTKKAAFISGFFCLFYAQIFAKDLSKKYFNNIDFILKSRKSVLAYPYSNSTNQSNLSQDFIWNTNLKTAYQYSFALKMAESRQILAKENPKNGIKIYVENLTDVLQILMTDDIALKAKLEIREDERLNAISKLDDKSPYKKLLQAEIRFQWAIVKLNYGDEVAAAWNVIKTYRLLEENQKQFPAFLPTKKLFGLLHVLIGTTPDNYKWVTKAIGIKGDVAQGLKELEEVTKNDDLFGTEAEIYTAYIQAYMLQNNEVSQALVAKLNKKNTDNQLINYLTAAVYLKTNEAEIAKKIISQKPKGNFIALAGYPRFEAEIALAEGNFEAAIRNFKQFISQTKGQSYVKDAYMKIGFSQLLNNNIAEAEKSFLKIKTVGVANKERDKLAQKFNENWLTTKQLPDKTLLKARFYFDGGFLNKALTEMDSKSEKEFTKTEEKAEFNYRFGRIYQNLNQKKKAIVYFDRAIVLSENLEIYYGANAALQAGLMLKNENPVQAKKYLLKAISFKKHSYKTSTDAKAKAALDMMK
jgi:hypothetical protein